MILAGFHPAPADKPVQVVYEKDCKTDDHRDIGYVFECRHSPKDDQHHVIEGVGKGEKGASAHCKISGKKACGNRQRACKKIGSPEKFKYEIKHDRNDNSHAQHNKYLFFCDSVSLYLRSITSLIRISQPGDKRENRHRQAHKNVGHKLAVIGKGQGYDTVEYAKYYHKYLSYGIALGAKDEGGHTDKRGNKRQNAASVKEQKGYYNNGDRAEPKGKLAHAKIFQKLFHFSSIKKYASVRVSSKT